MAAISTLPMSDTSDQSYIPSSESSDEEDMTREQRLLLNGFVMPGSATVKVARTQPRDPTTGEICFDVEYNDGVVVRVPIRSLMNLEEQFITLDGVSNAMEDWIAVAAAYPRNRRKCICCRRRATTGRIMCSFCSQDYGRRLMLSGLVVGKPLVRVPIDPENRVSPCGQRCGR